MQFKRLLLFFLNIWDEIWHAIGFEGLIDFAAQTFVNHSFKSLVIQLALVTTVLLSMDVIGAVEAWVFSPFTSVILITVMVVIDTLLGAFVAIRQGECFNIAKFTRLAPILISHLLVMSFAYHMSKIDGFLFGWLPQAVFAFFSGRNLMSIVRNMVVMKWLRGDFLQYLIDRVKPDLVDAMKPDEQDKKRSKAMDALPFLLFLFLANSCVTYTRCYEKFGKRLGDSTTHQVSGNVDVKLKADSTAGLVTPDELAGLQDGETLPVLDLEEQINPDATKVSGPRKPVITITRRGKDFEVKAKVPADTVRVTVKLPCKCPPPVTFKEPTDKWVWLATGAALGLVISLGFYYRGKA